MEIANGVIGSDVPMAILPGGTGNAMAFDLHIPRDLRQAAELICQSHNQRHVDLGQVGQRYFMLRVYTGPKEEQIASREMKEHYGLLAPLSGLCGIW
jgi:diacylglycerol kinase family enzyme